MVRTVIAVLLLAIGIVIGEHAGYTKAKADMAGEFYEGVEGYCFADKPPHRGACK